MPLVEVCKHPKLPMGLCVDAAAVPMLHAIGLPYKGTGWLTPLIQVT
jgi:hypothetical protein